MTSSPATPLPVPGTLSKERGRILLVDDDDRVRRAYGVVLRRSNFFVEEACDGRIAREKLAAARFDLVISDIGLPDASGLEVLRAARREDADVPVVLMTGGADLPSAIEAVEAGALHYLQKPVDRGVLCAAAEDGLRARESSRMNRDAREHYAIHTRERAAHREVGEQLDRAVASIRMAFQPIVRLSTRTVIAYEALVRPVERPLSSPALLFDAAERTSRLHEVGRAIRAEVSRTLAETERDFSMFVNLHPQDLFDDTLFDPGALLSKFAERVTLEITEHACLHDFGDIRERVEALQKMGFRIAIDDLGAGYAGLTAFTELRPDVVKLDMAFTRGVAGNPTKQMLVRTVRQLCAEVGAMLVVEGVETAEELDTLEDLGCDVFQGALFGMAQAPHQAVPWDRIVRTRD
jgi:EAL domain-containing protein (putative c-di-GMP-specific phosphodiesterase class I)